MSLAVFTDSTTAQASPALTCRPTSGSSTNTTSVNSCCAWSVMPTVATLPATRTHSCVFAYFKSEGMLAIKLLSQGVGGRSIRFSINWLRDEHRGGALATDFDLHGRAGLRKCRRHIAHANADAKRRTLRATGDLADLSCTRTRAPDCIVRARWSGPVGHLERHELLGRALRLLLGENGATDEFALVQGHKEAHPGLDAGGVPIQFVAVERVTHFRAQRVARAKTGRLQPVWLAGSEQLIPNRLDALARGNDFKSILARVTGAPNPERLPGQAEAGNLVLLQVCHPRHDRAARGRAGKTGVDEFHYARALHGHRARCVGSVLELHLAVLGERGQLRFQPGHVVVNAGGIDDQQILVGLKPIRVEIIDDSAALVAHQRVLALTGRQLAEVVGEGMIEESLRAGAADQDLAHVRDVKHAGCLAHGQVLVGDAGVLHRHLPAAEFDELAAQPLVSRVKRRAFHAQAFTY